MKKILTLLVMLLCGWSIVSAQTPAFGYQAVVRTADNEIVAEQPVSAVVTVTAGQNTYSESHANLMTDKYGMVGILVGTGTNAQGNLAAIDWTEATITTAFTVDNKTVTVTSGINAVPYALKAGSSKLTTGQIVRYLQDPNTTIEDYNEIMAALQENAQKDETAGALWEWIQEKTVEYLKNHKDEAVEVAASYLAGMTEEDVVWANNAVSANQKRAAINILAEYALANKEFALEVLTSYLSSIDENKADELISQLEQIWAGMVKEDGTPNDEKLFIYEKTVDFLVSHRAAVLSLVKTYFQTATTGEVSNALGIFNDNSIKQVLVNDLFFSYLDAYLPTSPNFNTNGLNEQQVKNMVNDALDNDYLRKTKCDGQEVDVCTMGQH